MSRILKSKKNLVRRYIDDLINSGRWDRAGAILAPTSFFITRLLPTL